MSKLSMLEEKITANDEPKENPFAVENEFSFENVIKKLGEINKAVYGINPYE